MLIADDVDVWVRAQKMMLEQLGIEVVEACGFLEASKIAQKGVYDLALVDLRLEDDSDDTDITGISICRELPSETLRILMIGHAATAGEVNRWIREKIIHQFLEKRESAAIRRKHINELLEQSGTNFQLQIDFASVPEHVTTIGKTVDPHWAQLATCVEELNTTPDELSYLFHRLIPKNIEFADISNPLPGGASGAAIVQVTVQHRDTGLKEHIIIKFGRQILVNRENENFHKFLAPLGARGFARLRWLGTSRNLSAVAYGMVNSALDPTQAPSSLAEYVRQPHYAPSDGARVITRIFSESCKSWFEAYCGGAWKKQGSGSVRRYFVERLWPDRQLPQIQQKLEDIVNNLQKSWNIKHSNGRIIACFEDKVVDTVDVSALVMREDQEHRWPAMPAECITHGDLHARNIIMVTDEPWIIDYGDCGWGHPFRDFAALETSLRFGVLYNYRRPSEILELERALAKGAPSLFPIQSPELHKAAKLSGQIKHETIHLAGCVPDWETQYKMACMFQLLKLAGINKQISGLEDHSHASLRRLLAFLSAGALAEALGFE